MQLCLLEVRARAVGAKVSFRMTPELPALAEGIPPSLSGPMRLWLPTHGRTALPSASLRAFSFPPRRAPGVMHPFHHVRDLRICGV